MRALRFSGIVGLVVVVSSPAPAQVCDGISETPGAALTTVRVATGLDRPLFVTAPPGDVDRLFVLEQTGKVRLLRDGAIVATPFLDLGLLVRAPGSGGDNEEGLLGLAFHPDYAANGRAFIHHTLPTGDNVVVQYTRSTVDPDQLDPATRQVVLALPHPTFTNHNGGMLAFGPDDGYLYIGTGDGGSGCDPFNNAQDGGSLNGKLLRIDVDSLPYTIPPDNPFIGNLLFEDEIWAYGLRNPWRFSFDAATGDLMIGDVGQSSREEIDHQPGGSPGGENYGWDRFEADVCPPPFCGGGGCNLPDHVPPIFVYLHSGGACSVTGGYVYRGCRLPDLRGTYFLADYCAAFIRSFRVVGGAAVDLADRTAELAPAGALQISEITSFGVDGRGELYIVDRGEFAAEGGEVFKIVPVLPALEVSGSGAAPLIPDDDGPWVWEDLAATSSHPITAYRVYRSAGRGDGAFDCVHESTGPAWTAGDPATPALSTGFTYVVTAVNAAGEETRPGTSSLGVARSLSAIPCPP